VRERYGKIAQREKSGCCSTPSCCSDIDVAEHSSKAIGYSEDELKSVPEGANLGLGCGNPTALTELTEGNIVLDLGSGAGFDCFLAARKVGEKGRVIGVDMTPEMLSKARENAEKGQYQNVEFRLGEIENLPAANDSVDVIISNCVINLSPDKARVFSEAFRVLKPGGRFMISDIVLLRELPDVVKNSVDAYVGCISGALLRDDYLSEIQNAGFADVTVVEECIFPGEHLINDSAAQELISDFKMTAEELHDLAQSIISIKIKGTKPL